MKDGSRPTEVSDVPSARDLYVTGRRSSAEDERSFFTSLRLRNRTYKTTQPRRLDDLNDLVLSLLPEASPLKIMDVAVSSGVTTLEWSARLTAAGVAHHMTAGDVLLNAFLVSVEAGVHVLVDTAGYPLQFEFWGRTVPNPIIRRRDLLYRPLIAYVEARLAKQFASLREACRATPAGQDVRRGRLSCRRITLVSPTVGTPAHIEFVDDDIQHQARWRGAFHVVRAANILNRSYFSDETLLDMIVNLQARLQVGGLLAVCRTTSDDTNLATVFCLREAGRLEIVGRLGEGSEIESLALSLQRL